MMNAPTDKGRPPLRRQMLTAHRWLSLGAAFFWLVQAITGVLIVFHWEINDASVSSLHRPTDLAAIERRIDTLAPDGSGAKVNAVWTTAGLADRYNIIVEDAGGTGRTVRVAGDGTPLQSLGDDESTMMGPLVVFHHDLFGGPWGSWIVAISGILLTTNLCLGLVAAWPKRGWWRTALKPVNKGPTVARLFSWHRALGLWVIVPAFVIVITGTLMKFEGGLSELVGAEQVSLPPNPATGAPVGFARAASAGLAAIPGSTLTAISWPKDDDATYTVRLNAPGEIRRAYGGSMVLVDANNGTVRGTFPIAEADAARGFMSALFPIHTGESAGLIGRLLSIAIGLWLITMIVAGTLLWARRNKPRKAKG
jgi:uncharacterized iron-regulated membrane protein